ncbi:DNA replication/repair protein RecF [Sphingomonas sp. NSE70-1]|uniref:DNA replication and repair protein RecF n=1 Tax=Sphingomonas caseinilyticus TaxID=2908205 RepID=A0ABT0RUQ6_9SPHN|nr:DNA replication/repair protein RecF [Sphingomonas caseinilyticus]MCL6698764.1 DNA replication/repair protein RecF [Sphingomonas caseinilyticus]
MTAVTRLSLTDFRNYRDERIEAADGFVLLSGPNGAGKTNVLEAVSLLTPGRGLRQVPIAEMSRTDGPGGFAVAAQLADLTEIGTGTVAAAPERRQVRINGAPAAVNSLGERLAVLWLTPAMDRLFTESAGGRRRFLDRLTLALEPGHAHHAARYEAAMRSRNKLLGDPRTADGTWLTALEVQMAEHGIALSSARHRTVAALSGAIAGLPSDDFPRAALALDGWLSGDLARSLHANRNRDAAAGRTTEGPHRQDLQVTHLAKSLPAARGSTGEQKALLLGIVLAHAELVAERRDSGPILLLDEVAAHLDPARREALFSRLDGRGQVWMTATEAALFTGISGKASAFHVEAGTISAA